MDEVSAAQYSTAAAGLGLSTWGRRSMAGRRRHSHTHASPASWAHPWAQGGVTWACRHGGTGAICVGLSAQHILVRRRASGSRPHADTPDADARETGDAVRSCRPGPPKCRSEPALYKPRPTAPPSPSPPPPPATLLPAALSLRAPAASEGYKTATSVRRPVPFRVNQPFDTTSYPLVPSATAQLWSAWAPRGFIRLNFTGHTNVHIPWIPQLQLDCTLRWASTNGFQKAGHKAYEFGQLEQNHPPAFAESEFTA
ncbi:hypothetical protein BDZ91DRAFT_764091 [Kalaharituber pfeilii]|nr:hypothetical protein BDZ91DRAFT_764091 [Kalaharituber pfeilii]